MSQQSGKKPVKRSEKQKQESSTKPNQESQKTSTSPQEPNQSQKPSKHQQQSGEQSSEEPCGSSQSFNPQNKSPVREGMYEVTLFFLQVCRGVNYHY